MDILRQLTRQFRAQDISDRSSATTSSLSSSSSSTKHSSSSPSTSSFATSSTTILRMKGDYIVDSGTASDEEEEEEEEGEVAGIFLPDSTTGAGHVAAALNDNTNDVNNEAPVPNRDSSLLLPCNVIAWNPLPTSAQRSPVIMTSDDFPSSSSSTSSSSSPFSSFGRRAASDAFPTMTSSTIDPPPSLDGRHSVSTSSDYERCSLDFEAASSCSSSSSSSELELFHSSGEEELAAINRDERRKRSRMSDDSSVFSDDDDDDDEEVNELFGRKKDEELLLRGGISVRLPGGTLLEASEVGGPGGGGGGGGRGVSPRKRYRRDCSWGVAATTTTAAASVGVGSRQRPSLDFYKMQKTCMIRKHHTINRPRLVKLWIVNGSQRPPKATFDPSPFCFRSLSWTQRNTGSDSPHQTR